MSSRGKKKKERKEYLRAMQLKNMSNIELIELICKSDYFDYVKMKELAVKYGFDEKLCNCTFTSNIYQ